MLKMHILPQLLRLASDLLVKRDEFFECLRRCFVEPALEAGFDKIVDAEETQAAGEEFGHGKIVEGVQHDGEIRVPFVFCQPGKRTESFAVGRFKTEFTFARAYDGPGASGLSGIMEGIRDEEAHVVLHDVHFGGTCFGMDHAVDDALRVNDDVNIFEWNVEKIVNFVNFEHFVDESRGVNADFGAHFPGGVGECLFTRDVSKLR